VSGTPGRGPGEAGLFAVLRTRGPAWNAAAALEQQRGWRAHADLMNGLLAEGFIVLGGPLAGTPDVLLVVRAASEAEIRARLGADPWASANLLTIQRIAPWTLRLGALG
jgi:uncharacterized protein YciI